MIQLKNAAICFMIATVCLMFTANKLAAQKAEFGVRFMPTISSFKMKTSSGGNINGSATLGFGVGAFLGFSLSDNFGIQVEAIYTSLNQEYKEQDEVNRVNLRYLNIPLLLTLNTGKTKPVNFSLVAGPQLGISAGSSITSTNDGNPNNSEPILSVKKSDVGFAYGAGLDFGLNETKTIRLGVGYRGVIGLIDISDNSATTSTNNYYVLEKTTIKTHSAYIGFSILF